MTVIAAVVEGGVVHMAADAFIGDGDRVLRDTKSKLWRTGDMLMGGAGSLPVADLVQYAFERPAVERGQEEDAYMRFTVPAALKRLFADHGYFEDKKEQPVEIPLTLLVAWRGRLWEIDGQFTTVEVLEPYNAIGSGGDVARAVLHSLPDVPPHERLQRAMETAARFVVSVAAPFSYEDTRGLDCTLSMLEAPV